MGSKTDSGAPSGAAVMPSRAAGIGSGADSGVPSGATEMPSGAAGTDSGADSGVPSGAAGKTVDCKTQPFFLCLQGCSGMNTGPGADTEVDSKWISRRTGADLTDFGMARLDLTDSGMTTVDSTSSGRTGADLTASGLAGLGMTGTDPTDSEVTVAFSTSSGKSGVDLPTSAVTAVDSADIVMATAFRAALFRLNRRFNVGGKRGTCS